MNPSSPIGMFDSGIGGTSIFKEIHTLLPNEDIIYVADSKNAPYGPKGKQKIIDLSVRITDFLLENDCKMVVVACNTATTNAISHLRSQYDIPFIGIEPAIKPAALNTKTKCIGILATKGTLSSELFHKTSNLFASDIKVIEKEGTGLVELIEDGQLESDELKSLLAVYLQPMIDQEIDHLVLGCTHYPYLIPIISEILPDQVTIIDSGEAVANQTKRVLEQNEGLNKGCSDSNQVFYTTGKNIGLLQDFMGSGFTVLKLDL